MTTGTGMLVRPKTGAGAAAGRWRSWLWVALALVVLAVIAGIGAYLTTPRPGGQMDPESTEPEGAHALVALLRGNGVEVVVANGVADVEKAARPDALILVAQSQYLTDTTLLDRLANAPGDFLLVDPTARIRQALLPGLVRVSGSGAFDLDPNCTLREANRSGPVRFGPTDTYTAKNGRPMTSCYDGALVRFHDGGRALTVVGSANFMTNEGLPAAGNAALAMNLAGQRPRLIWYAPQHFEGKTSSPATIHDLIPENVTWIVWQLWLVVLLLALWKGRRVGPLVAEELPVVVRASETVEGRGRLYRSRRARDRAADALRTAALQRLLPRLGIGAGASPQAVVMTIARRSGIDSNSVSYHLYGPPPASDDDLSQLAHALDEIERQVTRS